MSGLGTQELFNLQAANAAIRMLRGIRATCRPLFLNGDLVHYRTYCNKVVRCHQIKYQGDGTSMRGTKHFLALITGLLAACTLSANDNCVPPDHIVRIDDRNERLFIETTTTKVANFKAMRRMVSDAGTYIGKCHTKWGQGWSLSVFANKKYAGYKDEESIRKYVTSGEWEKAYLAEYDNTTKTLVRYPLQPEKRNERHLK